MSNKYYSNRDTIFRRFNSFFIGLAVFASFGILSAITYCVTSSNGGDVESLRAVGREKVKSQVIAAQASVLTPPERKFAQVSQKIKEFPKASSILLTNSAAYQAQLERLSLTTPGDPKGFKLFQAKTCATCHGVNSNQPILPIYPKLGGQTKDYLLTQMKDFKSGHRSNGNAALMKPLMKDLTDEEMETLAMWISEQKIDHKLSEDHVGVAIYKAKGCVICHGADAKTPQVPAYPHLSGQSKDYIVNQMKAIKSGKRHNGATAVMKPIVNDVSDEEMKAIADWLSTPAK